MRIAGFFKALVLATAAAALTGCATGPDVRTDYNPEIDFAEYETFGWAPELGTDRAGYSTITTNYFKSAVRAEMEELGYTYTDHDPDLLVNFFTRIRERSTTYTTPRPITTLGTGYYGYRYGLYTAWPYYAQEVETVHYKVGTANVDVVDAADKQLIWEGVAEGRLTRDALENPGTAIAETVDELFEEFPTRQSRRD